MLNVGGYARGVEVQAEPGVMHMVFGRRCFFGYVLCPDGEVWWFAHPIRPHEDHGRKMSAMPPEAWRDYLLDLFARDDSPAVELVKATPDLRTGWSTFDFPTVPTWPRDRRVIGGDAAHAMPAYLAQGACQAIEDAVVLARCLRDVGPVPRALATFESLRRERVERVVEQGRRNGDFKTLGWFQRTVVLPVVFGLLTRKGDPQAWVTAHHIDWDAPVRPPPVT